MGISLDGLKPTHDKFRRLDGAFDRSLAAVRFLGALGVKVGLRFTMTSMNAHDLPALLALMSEEGAKKFYFSHLNYAGRGNIHRGQGRPLTATRDALNLLFDRAWQAALDGLHERLRDGNNDADGPFLLHWVRQHLPRGKPP